MTYLFICERRLKMIYTKEVENMCPVAKGAKHEPAPIPEEGKCGKDYARSWVNIVKS